MSTQDQRTVAARLVDRVEQVNRDIMQARKLGLTVDIAIRQQRTFGEDLPHANGVHLIVSDELGSVTP